MAAALRLATAREHPLDSPVTLPSVAQFQRRPLDWRILADGEPPERDWAIKGWVGMGHTTMLNGIGGVGKTLIAQMIASALPLRQPFIDEIPASRRVLMWAAEDDHDEIWRRQLDIARHFGAGIGDFAGKLFIESYADRDCTLMDFDLGGRLVKTAMLDELREQIADYGAEVVILDNAARLFAGKESDRNQVTRFIAGLNAASGGAAVLLLAHPGRAVGSEFSGSSAWENSVRARMFLTDRKPDERADEDAEPNGEIRYLAKRKTNYSSRDLRSFRYENGVLKPQEPAGARDGPFGYLDDRRDERIVLEAFKRLTNGLNQQPTDASNAATFLPKLILQFNLGEGRSRHDLSKAMRRLQTDGKLRRDVVGHYANRSKKLGLVLAEDATECTK